jgi:hypothetical protein
MGNSFFNEIKPVGDNSWMAALGQQRQQQQDLAKLGEEFSRSSVDSVAAQGRQMLRNAGYDIPEPGQAKQFNYGPDYKQGVQAQAAQPGMASPALGQVGGNEAQYYQNQGAGNFDAMVKNAGIQQEPTTQDPNSGKYYRVVNGQKVNADEEVASMVGGAGMTTTPTSNLLDVKRQSHIVENPNIQTYQDSIAKDMGFHRGGQGLEQAIQGQMAKRDNQSAQAISDQNAQKEFANTDLLAKIRSHSFASTTSPAVAFGNGMQVIDQLEAQGKVSPRQALDLRDNFVLSFNDESFTGTRGTGSGKYFQEKLKKKTGRGEKAEGVDSVEVFDARGNLTSDRLAIPKRYGSNVKQYAAENPLDFINQYSNTFLPTPEVKRDMIDFANGTGKYKGKGKQLIAAHPIVKATISLTGRSPSGAIAIGSTASQNAQVDKLVSGGMSREDARAKVYGQAKGTVVSDEEI